MVKKSKKGVFICHSHADHAFARRLARELDQYGVTVWFDEAEIRAGDSLLEKISHAIDEMDFLVAILSPRAVKSAWVRKELALAMSDELARHRVKVLPVLKQSCEIPKYLKDKAYEDFRAQKVSFVVAFARLLDAIVPTSFYEEILEVVRQAIKAEFQAYREIPRVQEEQLDRYFTKTGSARAKIVDMLRRHAKRSWILTNPGNPSTADLLEIKLDRLEGGRAHLTTKEFWTLRWFDPKERRDAHFYSLTSKQYYLLVREKDGVWRVDINIYPRYSGAVRGNV